MKLKEIISELEQVASPALKEKWDNVGLMVGDPEQNIQNVFVCLDVTAENVEQAIEFGADLIISHHPLIFSPLKRIVENDTHGSIIRALITNNISVYSMHTNFDNADGGMNDLLSEKLGLKGTRHFLPKECCNEEGIPTEAIGRVGILDFPVSFESFVDHVSTVLCCNNIRCIGELSDSIHTVALCSGGGGDFIYTAYNSGADVYVTSDIKHHEAQLAHELGLNLIDAGHFETENIICEFLHSFLFEKFPDINVKISDATSFFI